MTSMTSLLDKEIHYESCVEYCQRTQKSDPKDKKRLAEAQFAIDKTRLSQGLPLQWYTAEELAASCSATNPKEPLLPPGYQPRTTRALDHYTAMTLDTILLYLQEMRKTCDGQTPIMGVAFGGLCALSCVEKDEEGYIVIHND